jgi:CxxC motif-containing protein (DUF1111 family)
MKPLKLFVLSLFAAAAVFLPFAFTSSVEGQAATEAPTTQLNALVDDLFNGNTATAAPFADNKAEFEAREEVGDGLGPCYNAQSCAECHQSPVTGAISQVKEFRAGHLDGSGNFVDAPGGSLINDRAVAAQIVERISTAETVTTFRTTTNALGDGFVEAIGNNTLTANVNNQPSGQRGRLINVAVFESNGGTRVGRFGWKDQQASLVSFSADAYLNEMGITSNFPGFTDTENTSNGNSVAAFDGKPTDPEDADNADVQKFADFMRATRAPGRGPITSQVNAGSSLFDSIGCAVCHTRTFTTSAPGTTINAGAFVVPGALGNKIIHPFSDFALHNVGTGDGIVQNGGQATANQLRTPPLWGVRTRNKLMHDGLTNTFNDAILRHAGQATTARNNYAGLSNANKQNLIAFLLSL